MNIKGKEEERGNAADLVYQKKTEEIVSFFKSIATTNSSYCLKVPEEFSMPTTYEEFLKGNFLCNPKFLIQSYLFEYIDSVEMYREFVRVVYELITEQIPNKDEKRSENVCMETGKKAQEVFDSLFISGTSCELSKKMKIFNELYKFESKWNTNQENMPLIENFYFNNLNRDGSEKSKSQIDSISRIKYKNHTVNMLLGIICCFSFDPITKEYTTKNLPSPSTDLKDFLRKYRRPTDLIDDSAYLDWCKVISNLHTTKKADETLTKFNPNAKLGIINLLYGIEALIGTPSNFKSRICYLEDAVEYLIKNALNYSAIGSIFLDLKMYIEEILQSFKTKNRIRVSGDKYQPSFIYQNTYDLVPFLETELSITYFLDFLNAPDNYIMFNLSIDNYREFKIDYKKNDKQYADAAPVEQDLQRMKTMTSSSTRYIDWIVSQYLYIKQNKLAYSKGKKASYEDVISRVLNGKPCSPNSLMLYGSLDNKALKSKIVELVLMHSNERNNVVYDNNMIKFTRSLAIGASSTVDSENSPFMRLYIYNENYEKCYPRNSGYIEKDCAYANYFSIVKEQFDSMCSSGDSLATSQLVALYNRLYTCNNKYLFFGSFYIFAIIINELSISGKETETIQNTKAVISQMQMCNLRKFNVSIICLSWLIRISCWYNEIPLAFTKVIYDCILPEDLTESIKLFFISDFIDSALNKTVHFMAKNKEALLTAEDDKHVCVLESREAKYKMVLSAVEGLLSSSARNNLSSDHLDGTIEK
ncbi:hypothetical protein NEQG_02649 [Nematocida parisii ERTm3]|uniref:Uncharacterized protein n=1 Tax=Nematocida parisii (strain ERTm3) TaxID=935791 RepID=I3ED61_NEMP3|nr:hypothetical protein NEQG_02649 [Nematocida parisii ERTm3]